MRIGTLTYHRADNYGAVLQAYALFKYLQNLGHEVEIIDYWPHYHASVYRLWCWNSIYYRSLGKKGKLLYLLHFPMQLWRNNIRKSNFDIFRNHYLNIAAQNHHYDAVFYGSDIIWNKWKFNTLHNGFDDVYWGGGDIKSNHKFSYAPSMGNVIDTEDARKQCQKFLAQFSNISVRERALKEKLEEWGYKKIQLVMDPTLLLSEKQWSNIGRERNTKKDYILCYNLECSGVINQLAQVVSDEKQLECVYLTGRISQVKRKNILDTVGPIEFLELFKNASYVLTSSFHGCVFSLIFKKQFCFHSNVQTDRIISLLHSCNLDNRFIDTIDTERLFEPIDYKNVEKSLSEMINNSKQYISACLKIAET